jgi:hypothetical protein
MKEKTENQTTESGGNVPTVWTPEYALKQMKYSNILPGTRQTLPNIVISHDIACFDIGLQDVFPKKLDLVIINQCFKRSFYGEKSSSGKENKPPICFSHNGLIPHPSLREPESDECETCEMSAFNTAKDESGNLLPGQACKAFITFVCFIIGYRGVTNESIFTTPTTPWELKIPPSSLKNHGKLVKQMEMMGKMFPLFPIQVSLKKNDGVRKFSLIEFEPGNDYVTYDQEKWAIFQKTYFEKVNQYLSESYISSTRKVHETETGEAK